MPITKIQSTTIHVSDQDAAVDFFVNKLGFEKRSDEPFGMGGESSDLRWIEVAPPGSETVIILAKGFADWPDRLGKFAGLVFGTDDIKATYEEYKAKGVKFTDGPSEQSWGMWQALFEDADGNGYVLVQR